MDELQKIYDLWSEEHGTTPEMAETGCRILEMLHEQCTDAAREEIVSAVIEYGRIAGQQAFFEGYRSAFLLWMEITRMNQDDD